LNIEAKSLLWWSSAALIAFLFFGPNALYLVGALFLLKLYFEYSEHREKEQLAKTYAAERKTAAQDLCNIGLKFLGDGNEVLVFETEFDASTASKDSAHMQVIGFRSWHFVVCGSGIENTIDAKKVDVLHRYLEKCVIDFDDASGFAKRRGKLVTESNQSKKHSLEIEDKKHKEILDKAKRRAADVRTRTKVDAGPNATALYIMSSEAGTKVGFSNDPKRRLSQLKTTHPGNLKLHRAWWFNNRADARGAEKRTHQLLEKRGVRMNGEWFSLTVSEVEKSVNKLIDEIYGVTKPR
jgi:Meiotically Up-regulated Gene 113 (MUG113) protein